MSWHAWDGHEGFTLIEVLVATALLVAMAIGVAQLMTIGVASGRASRFQTATAMLAASKLEELLSLPWAYEPGTGATILPRSDTSLSPSPTGTLAHNIPPYVDYLDETGGPVGTGPSPPDGSVFIRRWAVTPLPQDRARTLILSVLVTTVGQEQARGTTWSARSGDETLLVVLNTRKGR